jgi:hypothetical protein
VAISLTARQIFTLATGTSSTPTALSNTQVQLNWTGIYSSAVATRAGGGGTFTLGTSSNYTSSSAAQSTVTGNAIDTGLLSNTLYTYNLSLNNGNNIAISLTAQQIYTLCNITSAAFGTVTSSSVQITGIVGANEGYSKLDIYRGESFIVNIISPISSYTDSATIAANTLYSYKLLPYNGNNITGHLTAGGFYTVGSVRTAASGTSSAITNITPNTMQINWSGTYSTVSVTRTTGGGTFTAGSSSNYTSNSTPQTSVTGFVIDTALAEGTAYTYTITLFNANGVSITLTPQSATTTLTYITGFKWTRYDGHMNDVVTFASTFTPKGSAAYPNTTTGFTTDGTNLGTLTSGTQQPNTAADHLYSVEWLGYFYAPTSGNYQFRTNSDDESYLWIGNIALPGNFSTGNATVNNGLDHGMFAVTSANVALTAGTYYPFRASFSENGGGHDMQISFSIPSAPTTFIFNGSGYFFYKAF